MAEAKKPSKVAALRVSSRPETFRRGGIKFNRDPVDIPLSTLSENAIKLIKDEPMLAVQEVEVDLPAESEGGQQ